MSTTQDALTPEPITADPSALEYGVAGTVVALFGLLYYWLNPTLSTDAKILTAPVTQVASAVAPMNALTLPSVVEVPSASVTTTPKTVTPLALKTADVGTTANTVGISEAQLNQVRNDLALQQQQALEKLRNELTASHQLTLDQVRTELEAKYQTELAKAKQAVETAPEVIVANTPSTSITTAIEPVPTTVVTTTPAPVVAQVTTPTTVVVDVPSTPSTVVASVEPVSTNLANVATTTPSTVIATTQPSTIVVPVETTVVTTTSPATTPSTQTTTVVATPKPQEPTPKTPVLVKEPEDPTTVAAKPRGSSSMVTNPSSEPLVLGQNSATTSTQAGTTAAIGTAFDSERFKQQIERYIKNRRWGQPVILEQVDFGLNNAQLSNSSPVQLVSLAELLRNHPELKVLIRSYTEQTGNVDTDSLLSLARSQQIKNALVHLDISPVRLSIEGRSQLDKPKNAKDHYSEIILNRD